MLWLLPLSRLLGGSQHQVSSRRGFVGEFCQMVHHPKESAYSSGTFVGSGELHRPCLDICLRGFDQDIGTGECTLFFV